jgi:hypothetical protein
VSKVIDEIRAVVGHDADLDRGHDVAVCTGRAGVGPDDVVLAPAG